MEVLLQETPFQYGDSSQADDTLFIYQLIAYSNDDDESVKEVKKEFEKIHRQYNRKFFDSKYAEEKKGNEVFIGEHNYFVAFYRIAPLSVIWGKLESTHEIALIITLRIKLKENESVLPAPLFSD